MAMTLLDKIVSLNREGISVEFRSKEDRITMLLSVKDIRGTAYMPINYENITQCTDADEKQIIEAIDNLTNELNARILK